MNTRFEERLTSIPEIPKEFGEDGGYFYRYYDALADEIDDDMVKSLKAQLDGILIYAGLFAGVNSAFLALTLPGMSADPADDTNALLLQLVSGGNQNITSTEDLPSASFSPPSGIFPVNLLFSLSLTLALLAAFLAVLGQQWLVYYRKRGGGGAEAQRWEQLRRHLGAKRWRLEAVLDDILPSLLQLGLVIFCIAFALYLATLSRWLCYTVAIPMGLALACVLVMAISAAVDHWCPFKSPLSRVMRLILPRVGRLIWPVIWICMLIGWATRRSIRSAMRLPKPSFPAHAMRRCAVWLTFGRPPEPVERLKAIAAKRILCTSEDTNALIYTATNLQALESKENSLLLLNDEEFYKRLTEVRQAVFQNTTDTRPPSHRETQVFAYHSSFLHLAFCSGSLNTFFPPHRRSTLSAVDWFDSALVRSEPTMVKELRDTISALNQRGQLMQMHLSLEKAHSSALTLFQDLIDTILNAADSARLHSWFISYEVLHQSSQTPEPLLAIMLVFASDAYVLFGAGMSNAGQLNGTPDVPLEQRLRIVCNMLKSYGGLNVRKTLKHIVQAFRKYKAQQQPGHKMHVCLIEQALLFSKDPSLESASNSLALVAIYAVDLVLSLIKPARESLSADKRVVANSNVSRCLEVLLEIFALMSGLEMWGSSKHEETISDIVITLLEMLELVTHSVSRRMWTFDDSTISNILELRNVITDPGSDHPSGMVDPEGSDRSWYIDLYDKLQSAFEELASAEVASARPASQWVLNIAADPADPPVFNTQGAEMDPGPSKSAKGKEKETFEDVASAAPREEDGGNPGSAIDSAAKTVASDRGEDS